MSIRFPSFNQLAWLVFLPVGLGAFVFAQPARDTSLPAIAPTPIAARASPRIAPSAKSDSPWAHRALLIPVQGVKAKDLVDTWGVARSEGRTHEGVDIMAPQGIAVLAAVDGRVVKFFDSARGGVTIYQFDDAERFVFYYAHLHARAPWLAEGDAVKQGQLIGYVGATGNATTPHLHFEIQRLGPEREWWRAEAINPYPFLITGQTPG